MPFTWRINIRPNPQPSSPAIYQPQQVQAEVGDQIIWSNDDNVPHFPTPAGRGYQFMPNQIAAHSTSPAFAPGTAGTINYFCSLHPSETGTIVVTSSPAQ